MWFFILIGCVGFFICMFVDIGRHRRNYDAHLWPMIEAAGFEFVRSRIPNYFQVGPFPKFEVRFGGMHSEIAGISGEYVIYRIVTIRDSQNREHEVWAKLEFEGFRLRHVEWRPELSSLTPKMDLDSA